MTGEAAQGREQQPPATDEDTTRESAEGSGEKPASSPDAEDTAVPAKQIHRWKDDGGAVIFD